MRRSMKCYLDQTYPNRELVIVNEGPPEYQKQLEEYVATFGRDDIHCVWLKGYYTLGALRNIAIGLCHGDLFCQWDDDDFCLPQRLSVQYSYLSKRPRAKVCYLADQLHYYFHTKELWWDNWQKYQSANLKRCSLVPGTILSYRDVGVRYPSSGQFCSAGEDSVFADALITKDYNSVVLLEGMGYMHVYSYHGTNQVYGIGHHMAISENRSEYKAHVEAHESQIRDTLNYLQFEGEVKVMSREGLVFTHRCGDD